MTTGTAVVAAVADDLFADGQGVGDQSAHRGRGRAVGAQLDEELEGIAALVEDPSGRPGPRLRVLHQVAADAGRDPFAPASLSTSVNRQTLREILAAGLGRRIRVRRRAHRV